MYIIITVGALAAVISAIFAFLYHRKLRKRENPDIKMGFAIGGQIVDLREIKPEPEIDPKTGIELGQRLYFRISNGSTFSVKTPICSVKFPEVFKHKRFVDKQDGSREYFEDFTANSDLWGLGKETTNINTNLPNSAWEIYGMPALMLRSGETIEFFVRFSIPKRPMTYNLEIKLDAEGTKGFFRKLKLVVTPS